MKLIATICAAIMSVLIFTNCTPGEITANSEFVAGSQFATYTLSHYPNAKAALDEMKGVDATAFVTGSLDAVEYGRLSALTQILPAAANAKPNNKTAYNQIMNLISAGAKSTSGSVNPYQGPVIAGVINFQRGIQFGEDYNSGRQQVIDAPITVTQVAAARASVHP